MRPTDIPGLPDPGDDRPAATPPPQAPSQAAPQAPADVGAASNPAVRAAVEAFAEEPGRDTTIDVLRSCLAGYLLLDVTGSELTFSEDGEVAEGSTVSVQGGQGPDGQPALFAFTSQEELARTHEDEPDGTRLESLVQDAAAVLELVLQQESKWLYLDPAGPTCALAAQDIEAVLQVPRNDTVRQALEPAATREQLLAALQADGPLVLAVTGGAGELAPGVTQERAEVEVLTSDAPDESGTALLVFTSAAEMAATAPEAQVVVQEAREVVALARSGFAGLIVNAGGPYAWLPSAELGS